MTSLLARIEGGADGPAGVTFVGSAAGAGEPVRVPFAQLHEEAQGMAAALQARGVAPGDHVALLGPTSRDFATAVQATWLTGATVVCLPLPMRLGSIEEFTGQTRQRIRNARARLVVVDRQLEPFIAPEDGGGGFADRRREEPELVRATKRDGGGGFADRRREEPELVRATKRDGDPPMVVLDELRGDASRWERPPDDPEALAVLQFTSGSTADPKGVMLPGRCLISNIDAIVEGAALSSDDVGVSWLPLYHDMGLIGMLTTPMITGFELVLAAPQDFLAAPADWMHWMSEYRATVTCGPNFAYALAARAMRRMSGLDLSPWRIALNGAEPIDPDAVESFCESGAPHGLDAKSAFCVYGMAEATLAISFPEPSTGMGVDTVDRHALELERYAAPATNGGSTRRLALLGRPLRGIEVRVADPDTGSLRADREVGEIELRGESLTPGYFEQPDLTEATFHHGWLRTGDLGYIVDGEVVVCGRIKDVIIVGGRNVFPEEIERAAADVVGVRAGNVIAFGAEGRRGREGIVVVAETKADDTHPLREQVVARVCDVVGVPPRDVILVQAGSLPKTSSGKLQRSLCRTRYLEDQLSPV